MATDHPTPAERSGAANPQSSNPHPLGLRAGSRGKQPRLQIVPCSRDEAQAFVTLHHRHHNPRVGDKFCLAVADETGKVRGVAQVGLPTGPWKDDVWTLEVTRVATDGCENACSALYGAAWRAARALGWRRLITYTLTAESGSSLRAAGWKVIGERPARSWAKSSKRRPRVDTNKVTGPREAHLGGRVMTSRAGSRKPRGDEQLLMLSGSAPLCRVEHQTEEYR